MEGRDRRRALLLIGLAAVAWAGVAAVLILVDPLSSSAAGFAGAGAIGAAAALTTAPLFWLVSFARHNRIAYRGDWWRALRRGIWVGALVAVFVIMRVNGIFQLPIALFFIALAIVAEVTLTAGGANRA
ncbi:MAG TPA: hypothetical protein VFI15_10630 [Candidatus Limnocylindrales bacterium]|nr:hypothetical protein [Candidatus Limnocylindrales bacterium]